MPLTILRKKALREVSYNVVASWLQVGCKSVASRLQVSCKFGSSSMGKPTSRRRLSNNIDETIPLQFPNQHLNLTS